MSPAKTPFRLHPCQPRPATRRPGRRRRRITKDELAALENSAKEAVRFGEHTVALLESVPPYAVKLELRRLELIGQRASAVLEQSGGVP